MNKIPKRFQTYFWDTDIAKIDPKAHQTYVIERILEYGNSQAYRWLTETYPKKIVKEVLSKSRKLSEKTKNFWQIVS